MRFSIITCLFFLVLFIQQVAAEEAELELEMGLVKIMRAGKALVFNEKGSKIPLLLKDEILIIPFSISYEPGPAVLSFLTRCTVGAIGPYAFFMV